MSWQGTSIHLSIHHSYIHPVITLPNQTKKEPNPTNHLHAQHTLTPGTHTRLCDPLNHQPNASLTNTPTPNSLVGTGNVDRAAIFNNEGNSVWATSAGFTVSPTEMQEVVAAYKDTGDVKQVQSTGLHIAGERFIVIKADDRSIYGKKVSFLVDYPGVRRWRVEMNESLCASREDQGRFVETGLVC